VSATDSAKVITPPASTAGYGEEEEGEEEEEGR
jgi:hypothetical protein